MSTREIRGKAHKLVVLRVLDWDELGRPSKCIVGYDDTTFDLRDESVSREFMTAYVPEEMVKPRTRNN
jgi:hypothetical protein